MGYDPKMNMQRLQEYWIRCGGVTLLVAPVTPPCLLADRSPDTDIMSGQWAKRKKRCLHWSKLVAASQPGQRRAAQGPGWADGAGGLLPAVLPRPVHPV
jgi:hypothetical protein